MLDFGIAKLLHGSESGRGLTNTGAVVGTPAYMAPEQCGMRMPVSDRTDVYALGIMLFEMLAGKPPFFGEGPTALIGQHLFVDPPPLPPTVSPDTAALVLRMLAKGPADRPSMAEVVTTLSSLGDFSRISRIDLGPPLAALTPAVLTPAATSGTAPAVGPTTIGQSTGERVPAPPSPARWSPPIVVAIAALVLLSASGTLWIMLGQRSAPPSSPPRPPSSAQLAPALPTRPLLTAAAPPAASLSAPSPAPPSSAPVPVLSPGQPSQVQAASVPPATAQPLPAPPAAPLSPPPVAPAAAPGLPRAADAAESAASCRASFAHKRYLDAVVSCNAALASNPNQPAVRLTLRNAVARLSAGKRARPPAAPTAAPPPPSRVEPPVVPAPPVKEHYEKVQPID